MRLLFWVLMLLAAVWAAHWGANQLASPLQKLRQQWGLNEAAGAAFVALATASPEIGTNTASAVQGLSEIGLGNLLGSNIISVPVIVGVAYVASRTHPTDQSPSKQFSKQKVLQLKSEALTVQAIPYLGICLLATLLLLPKPWRGLQPIDGWIMLLVYVVYLGQAILRKRQQRQPVRWQRQELIAAILGVVVLAAGAYLTVTATEKIVGILKISQVLGGLFITSTLSIAPEVFATWSIAKSGQITAATTGVIADNSVTMTLALFPLAMVSLPIKDLQLFTVNLVFVITLGAFYAGFIQWGKPSYSFELKEVVALILIYIVYLVVMLFGVLRILG